MKKKQKLVYKNIEFDSKEEIHFYMWCEEAQEFGFIKSFQYHPKPLNLFPGAVEHVKVKLKTKTKTKVISLLQPHSYQMDFKLYPCKKNNFSIINDQIKSKKGKPLKIFHDVICVDIKPAFVRMHDSSELFSVKQKWVWEKTGLYINKVIVEKLFKYTWCPSHAFYGKRGKILKKYAGMKTISEFRNDVC